jgi:hypothetical protein
MFYVMVMAFPTSPSSVPSKDLVDLGEAGELDGVAVLDEVSVSELK